MRLGKSSAPTDIQAESSAILLPSREARCNPVVVSKLSWIRQEQALQAQSRTVDTSPCEAAARAILTVLS